MSMSASKSTSGNINIAGGGAEAGAPETNDITSMSQCRHLQAANGRAGTTKSERSELWVHKIFGFVSDILNVVDLASGVNCCPP